MSAAGEDLATLVRAGTQRLAAVGIASARVDAELLAAHLLGVGRGELLAMLARGERLPAGRAERWRALLAARQARTPLQHLTGRAAFRRLELAVGPGVFVPRPETEVLAGHAVEEASSVAARAGTVAGVLVVDLCAGSGAIGLAVADEVAAVRVVALELDPLACDWAARNLAAQPAGRRVRLRRGDVTGCAEPGGVLADLAGGVDVVVANPPYIPAEAVPVEPEVAEHDPPAALYGGGRDGLDVPRAVVAAAAVLLRPGGLLLMEHADVQGERARALVAGPGWEQVATRADLAGRDRVLSARSRGR